MNPPIQPVRSSDSLSYILFLTAWPAKLSVRSPHVIDWKHWTKHCFLQLVRDLFCVANNFIHCFWFHKSIFINLKAQITLFSTFYLQTAWCAPGEWAFTTKQKPQNFKYQSQASSYLTAKCSIFEKFILHISAEILSHTCLAPGPFYNTWPSYPACHWKHLTTAPCSAYRSWFPFL